MTALLAVVVVAIGLILLRIGVAMLWLVFCELRRARATRTWPSVSGRVLESTVEEVTDSEGSAYRPRVAYAYSVAGEEYSSECVSVGQGTTASRRRAEQTTQRYPVGSRVAVHHDPSRPSQAVLETGVGCGTLVGLALGTSFVVCGLVLLTVSLAAALKGG
jgi:hypothetical protein